MDKVKRLLLKELREIWDDRDFICGAMSNAGNEAAWSVMLDYIQTAKRHGKSVSSDEILLLSLDLGEESDTIPRVSGSPRKLSVAIF